MARLLSVNVGLPRDIEWKGRTVHTGIWKDPVRGRRRVGRLNLEGDGQGDLAGHGGEQRAVFVYQIESYRYWQEQLKRTDFVHGQFGENFTIEGLPDDTVCIGDRPTPRLAGHATYRGGRHRFFVSSATTGAFGPIIACLVGASAAAQTAREVRGAAAVEPLQNEPPAKITPARNRCVARVQ